MADAVQLRLLGVPVTIDPTFFLLAILLGLGEGRGAAALLTWVVVVLVSVLGHELGHAMALRGFGSGSRIHLHAMGGLTAPTGPAAPSARQHVVVSLAGPVPGILVGSLLLAVTPGGTPDSLVDWVLRDLALVNLGWGVLNLMPVLPLDGGQVLAGLFAARNRSLAPAVIASAVIGGGLAVTGFVAGQWWLGALFGFLAVSNASALVRARRERADSPGAVLAEGYEALEKGATMAAANRAREALAGATTAADRDGAVNLLMWVHLLGGDVDAAAEVTRQNPPWDPMASLLHPQVVRAAGDADAAVALLQRTFDAHPGDATRTQLARGLVELGRLDDAVTLVDGGRAPYLDTRSAAVVGAGLFRAGRYGEAAQLGEASFERSIDKAMAYNVACAWVRDGRPDDALAWLHRAVDAGYANLAELDRDPNLADLRGAPEFDALRGRLTKEP